MKKVINKDDVIAHSAKGKEWKKHKYIEKIIKNGKTLYFYTQSQLDAYKNKNEATVGLSGKHDIKNNIKNFANAGKLKMQNVLNRGIKQIKRTVKRGRDVVRRFLNPHRLTPLRTDIANIIPSPSSPLKRKRVINVRTLRNKTIRNQTANIQQKKGKSTAEYLDKQSAERKRQKRLKNAEERKIKTETIKKVNNIKEAARILQECFAKDSKTENRSKHPQIKDFGRPMTSEEAFNGTNPKYFGEGHYVIGYSTNCSYCTLAYDMRRRGYDVQAPPEMHDIKIRRDNDDGSTTTTWIEPKKTTPDYVASYWGQKAINEQREHIYNRRTYRHIGDISDDAATRRYTDAVIKDINDNNPVHSYGEVGVYWENGGGHSVVWEKRGEGDIVFLDAQTHEIVKPEEYLDISLSSTWVRIDNKELSTLAFTHMTREEENVNTTKKRTA